MQSRGGVNPGEKKRRKHHEQPPAQLVRNELADVLSHLPEREAMQQSIRRTCRRNMPTNLRMLEELEDIPDQYQRTLQGERFLMFDGSLGPGANFCDSKKY